METLEAVGGVPGFGSLKVPMPGMTVTSAEDATSAFPNGPAPEVPLTDAAFQETPLYREAAAQRQAAADREPAEFMQSMGAAMSQWTTLRLKDRLTRPDFEDDTPINQVEFLNRVPIDLTEDERELFMDVGVGEKSADYIINYVKESRMAHEAMGDHSLAAFVGTMADPVWLWMPPALKASKAVRSSALTGRTASAVYGAAGTAALTNMQEGAVSSQEVAVGAMLGAGVGALAYVPGQGLKQVDNAFPAAKLQELTHSKPRMRATEFTESTNEVGEVVRTPSKWEPVPQELVQPSPASTPKEVAEAAASDLEKQAGPGAWDRFSWNVHKTMNNLAPDMKLGDFLFDSYNGAAGHSLDSERAIVLTELRQSLHAREDLLMRAMSEDGYGLLKRANPFSTRKAAAHQRRIDEQVRDELLRREQYSRMGVEVDHSQVPKRIRELADATETFHKKALAEQKLAGVEGADAVKDRAGWFHRSWNSAEAESMMQRMMQKGLTKALAREKVAGLIGLALRRGNPTMDEVLAGKLGNAFLDRALAKGRFEDVDFNTRADAGSMARQRDIMRAAKMSDEDIERVLDVVRVKSDDAGKSGFLQHRLDLDYRAGVMVGGELFKVTDLIDSNLTGMMDQYAQAVATNVAFARKGLKKASDIEAKRKAFLDSVPIEKAEEAAELFDNTIAYWKGLPSGAKMNKAMHNMMQFGRMISLPWVGLWQVTEFASVAAEYGLMKSLKYGFQELPGFKTLFKDAVKNPEDARSMYNILTHHAESNIRIRPFINRFEDGWHMDMQSTADLTGQQMGQLVPYANGMKWVHGHAARTTANLIVNRLEMAAKGNVKAVEALQKYGLSRQVLDRLGAQIEKHGYSVDKWSDGVWEAVRPAFGRMMDESVLQSKLGDIPAFVAFDQLGKFFFMYRTFSITAHNKLLTGRAQRDGAAAVGLLLTYQFPLAMLAVKAQAGMRNEELSDSDTAKKALGVMGGLGLLSDPIRIITGDMTSWNMPAVMALDRGVTLAGAVAKGDASKAGETAMTMMPVVMSSPVFRMWHEHTKE